MVVSLYDRYVCLPTTDEEWHKEIRGFLENYEFPWVGAWDGSVSQRTILISKKDTLCI